MRKRDTDTRCICSMVPHADAHGRWACNCAGKCVVVMPDADEAGQRYRDSVVASLQSRGIECRVVEFADAGAKDVSAFLEQGGTKEELVQRIGADWVRTTEFEVHHVVGSIADI